MESVDENKENKLYINAENNDYEEDTEAERGELAENSGSVDVMSCDSIRNIKTVVLDLTAILPCGKPVLTGHTRPSPRSRSSFPIPLREGG